LPDYLAFRHLMSKKLRIVSITLILLVVIVSYFSFLANPQNVSPNPKTNFQNQITEKPKNNTIYFSIPNAVNEYFEGQNHFSFDNRSYSKFVTPKLFTKIAQQIKNNTNTQNKNETFTNLVLNFVQQINYKKSAPKFAIETLADNYGDCDSLSYLAASIMKAAGLDVVLFLYENQTINHMNVGVNLPEKKLCSSNTTNSFFYQYNEKKYFVAETTSKGWKLGQQPKKYFNSKPKIIPIQDFDEFFFEPIPTRINYPLNPSELSLNIKPVLSDQKISETIEVFGSLNPKLKNQKIVILVKHESFLDTITKSVYTDNSGKYQATINVSTQGKYSVQSVWMGNEDFSASETQKIIVNIGLSNILKDCEETKQVAVANQIIQIPTLNDLGKRILVDQPVKTIFDKNYSMSQLNIKTKVTMFGNEQEYFTKQDVIVPEHKKQFFDGDKFITEIVPEKTVEVRNFRDKLHSKFLLTVNKVQNEFNFKIELYDRSKAEQLMEKSQTRIVDISESIKENIEYAFNFQTIEDKIILQIFDQNKIVYTETSKIDFSKDLPVAIAFSFDPDSISSLIVFEDNFENKHSILQF